MSRNAKITTFFGDGRHDFRLAIGQLEELQEKTDCGPRALYKRIVSGEWRVQDLRETLRLGLIGGGMKPFEADALVDRYCGDACLIEAEGPASAVLLAALIGAPDEDGEPAPEETDPGEGLGTATAATPSPMKS